MSDDAASTDGLRWQIRRSLIERLRIPWEGMGDMANQQRAEAAIHISTMMDEIEAWRQAVQKAQRDIMQLRQHVTDLLGERDEARKLLCDEIWLARGGRMSVDLIARERGWDCFKEEHGTAS